MNMSNLGLIFNAVFNYRNGIHKILYVPSQRWLVLAGICGILFGIGTYIYGGIKKNKILNAAAWPVVPGRVTVSKLGGYQNGNDSELSAHIEYTYRYNNKNYTSRKINMGGQIRSNNDAIVKPYLEKYPVGREISVSVNPLKPEESVVELQYGFMEMIYRIFGFGWTIMMFMVLIAPAILNHDFAIGLFLIVIIFPFLYIFFLFQRHFVMNDATATVPAVYRNFGIKEKDAEEWEVPGFEVTCDVIYRYDSERYEKKVTLKTCRTYDAASSAMKSLSNTQVRWLKINVNSPAVPLVNYFWVKNMKPLNQIKWTYVFIILLIQGLALTGITRYFMKYDWMNGIFCPDEFRNTK